MKNERWGGFGPAIALVTCHLVLCPCFVCLCFAQRELRTNPGCPAGHNGTPNRAASSAAAQARATDPGPAAAGNRNAATVQTRLPDAARQPLYSPNPHG